MSRPRAATFVATSSLARPLRKRSITPSRRPWGMSPCSGTASKPRAPSCATSSSTVILRRRNTIEAAGRSRSRIAQSTSSLRFGSTSTMTWSIVSTVSVADSTFTCTGSYR